jgi:hypothetical protein
MTNPENSHSHNENAAASESPNVPQSGDRVTVEIDRVSYDAMRSAAFRSAMNPEKYLRTIIGEGFTYHPQGVPLPPASTIVEAS